MPECRTTIQREIRIPTEELLSLIREKYGVNFIPETARFYWDYMSSKTATISWEEDFLPKEITKGEGTS